MTQREFEREWKTMRRMLYGVLKKKSFPVDAIEDLLSSVAYLLSRRYPTLPCCGASGFRFDLYCYYMMNKEVIRRWRKEQRRVSTLPIEYVNPEGDTSESAQMAKVALTEWREEQRSVSLAGHAEELLRERCKTERECRMARMLAEGRSYKSVSDEIGISKQRIQQIMSRRGLVFPSASGSRLMRPEETSLQQLATKNREKIAA